MRSPAKHQTQTSPFAARPDTFSEVAAQAKFLSAKAYQQNPKTKQNQRAVMHLPADYTTHRSRKWRCRCTTNLTTFKPSCPFQNASNPRSCRFCLQDNVTITGNSLLTEWLLQHNCPVTATQDSCCAMQRQPTALVQPKHHITSLSTMLPPVTEHTSIPCRPQTRTVFAGKQTADTYTGVSVTHLASVTSLHVCCTLQQLWH
jgi:hypothetical protein